MQEYAGEVLRFVGGIGLFFSFTEVGKRMQMEVFHTWDLKALLLPADLWSLAGPQVQEHQRPAVQPRSLPLAPETLRWGTADVPPLCITFLPPSNVYLTGENVDFSVDLFHCFKNSAGLITTYHCFLLLFMTIREFIT